MEELSAMVDGELDTAASARIATGWRDDGHVRAAWHAYHLIGDVLRSEDLACAGRNEAFLQRVRARLAEEPVVLAPAAADRPAAQGFWSQHRWGAAAAVAAGFMVVGGALVVMRGPQTPGASQVLASSEGASGASVVPASTLADARAGLPEQVLVVNGSLVRDARLDRYLAAHKQFDGSTVLGTSSGFLRSATHEAPSR